MLYGNYWNDDQVVVARVDGASYIPQGVFENTNGAPAFIAIVMEPATRTIKQYIFVEIIPDTEIIEHYLDLTTGNWERALCAKINIYRGPTHKFEDMDLLATDSWPLAWFNLKEIPTQRFDTYAAYERAMSIIGG